VILIPKKPKGFSSGRCMNRHGGLKSTHHHWRSQIISRREKNRCIVGSLLMEKKNELAQARPAAITRRPPLSPPPHSSAPSILSAFAAALARSHAAMLTRTSMAALPRHSSEPPWPHNGAHRLPRLAKCLPELPSHSPSRRSLRNRTTALTGCHALPKLASAASGWKRSGWSR